jgi:hypothetical protein
LGKDKNMDALAAAFQRDLNKEKRRRKSEQELEFSIAMFIKVGKALGITRKEVCALFEEDQDDPPYDIKIKYPDLAHISTTSSRITDNRHLFKPVREMPHGIWDKYLASCVLAAEYGEERSALIFRVKMTPWVMTSESLSVPQLTPVVLITTASGLPDIRAMRLGRYLSIRY